MIKRGHGNMNEHLENVKELKRQFSQIYQSVNGDANHNQILKIIRDMRVIHGCAIYAAAVFRSNIGAKDPISVTDDEWIQLSANESVLSVIQDYIRKCENDLYRIKSSVTSASNAITGLKNSENMTNVGNDIAASSKVKPIIRTNADGTNELSIQNMTTEADTGSKTQEGGNCGMNTPPSSLSRIDSQNTTEILNGLTNTEADRMYKDYQLKKRSQNGGNQNRQLDFKKPTIINYWADWCPYSTKFTPQWKSFVEKAKSVYPDIQVLDLNVSKDPELQKLAQKVGVKGFPTLVYFNNNKKYYLVAGNSTVDDIMAFIQKST